MQETELRKRSHARATVTLLCLCFLHWQGRYSGCQWNPPPLVHSLLVSDRRLKHLRRCGCRVAFWEMQSCVSDGCMAKWKDQHWKHVTDCLQGVTSFSANTPSPLFLPVSPLSCLSPSLFVCDHLTLPSISPSPVSPRQTRDLKKVGVTIVGPQKKIVSSLKALDSHAKNGPVPV